MVMGFIPGVVSHGTPGPLFKGGVAAGHFFSFLEKKMGFIPPLKRGPGGLISPIAHPQTIYLCLPTILL